MTNRILVPTLVISALLAFCFEAYSIGVRFRDASLIDNARIISEENKDFCSRYLVSSASGSFDSCVRDLMEVRRRHEMRLNDVFYYSAD